MTIATETLRHRVITRGHGEYLSRRTFLAHLSHGILSTLPASGQARRNESVWSQDRGRWSKCEQRESTVSSTDDTLASAPRA